MARAPVPPARPPGWARRRERRVRLTGATAGLALVALALPMTQVPGGAAPPSADVTLRVAAGPEVAVSAPASARVAELVAGGRDLHFVARLRNLTGRDVRVGVRARADAPGLDRALLVAVHAPGGGAAPATLAALRAAPAGAARIPSGGTVSVEVRARLDAPHAAEAGGRAADVTLDFPVLAGAR